MIIYALAFCSTLTMTCEPLQVIDDRWTCLQKADSMNWPMEDSVKRQGYYTCAQRRAPDWEEAR